jgi:hypothetical protein
MFCYYKQTYQPWQQGLNKFDDRLVFADKMHMGAFQAFFFKLIKEEIAPWLCHL